MVHKLNRERGKCIELETDETYFTSRQNSQLEILNEFARELIGSCGVLGVFFYCVKTEKINLFKIQSIVVLIIYDTKSIAAIFFRIFSFFFNYLFSFLN